MSSIEYQQQIEESLERPLEPAELAPARALDELSDVQLAVVRKLAPRNAYAAMLYLRAVVTNISVADLKPFVDSIAVTVREGDADRTSSGRAVDELPNLPLFEHHLGRQLEPTERAQVSKVEELSPLHLVVASTLLRADRTVGFIYLQRILPSLSHEEHTKLAAELLRLQSEKDDHEGPDLL